MGNREAMQPRKKDRAEADTALEVAGSKNQPQTRGWGDSVGVNRAWRAHKSLHSRNIVKGVSRLSTQLRAVQFRPFVYDAMNQQVSVAIEPMTPQDAATTTREPQWQTDWTSEYISKGKFDIYGLKTQIGELVALGAYEISEDVVTVHIVYMESQAQSNPTLCERPKYHGIGQALIAYGIKLSVDAGFNGDVTLDAKTPELARHYERDFRALLIPGRERGAAPRYLICDEAARDIFVSYLEEG